MTISSLLCRSPLLAGCLALAACGDATTPVADDNVVTATATNVAVRDAAVPKPAVSMPETVASRTADNGTPPRDIQACSAEIGAAAAQARVVVCRNVSPATHPPCNAANSCAMIEDEIARSCALFDGKGPPMQGCGPDPKSGQAAADVVRRYYSALNARDFSTAWLQWGHDGQPGVERQAFEQGFAHTRASRVTIGRMEPSDAGAGSVYQPVPVTIDATRDDGTHQRFTGTYVIRRVNGVDGARPDQLRWHIDSAKLRAVAVR